MCLSLWCYDLRVGGVFLYFFSVHIIEYFECFFLCTFWLIGELTFKTITHCVRQNTTCQMNLLIY